MIAFDYLRSMIECERYKNRKMERKMPQIGFAVLGTPAIWHDGQLLKFPTRKTQALLIYLMIEGGIHARAQLTGLLWPESTTANGRAALRVALAQLREQLNEDNDAKAHLIIDRETLGFNFASPFESDLHTVRQAFKAVGTATTLSSAARGQIINLLRAAVDAHRGDFLENFSLSDALEFDQWASVQRETCYRQMETIFDYLAQLLTVGGDTSGVIDIAGRWVARHPLNEAAHRALIQARFVAGDRLGALLAYDRYRDILKRELNVTPSPEITALAERIRVTVLPRRAESRDRVRLPSAPMLLEGPLVGRAGEFGRLVEVYSLTCDKQMQAIVVQGEAGTGKTRLANEFIRWASAQGADVLEARAFETGAHVPYQTLIDALRTRMALINAPEDLLSDIWLAELSRLLPELRERYPDLPAPTADESTARGRLFEAVARFGLALAERSPIVFFIDDLQWADAASLDLLHYCGQRWRAADAQIMVLLNLRSEIVTLSGWLTDLTRAVPVTTLPLGPLTPADTLQLVQALSPEVEIVDHSEPSGSGEGNLGNNIDLQRFSQWLFTETNGQPFYIVEMLKALLERGTLALKPSDSGRWFFDFTLTRDAAALRSIIPSGVRAVVRTRLSHLNPSAYVLIVASAVLGHEFTFEQLCRVAALDENTALTALEQTLTNRLLRETTQTNSDSRQITYGFVHDKIREVVYSEVNDARRHIFHRRAFEVLQDSQTAPAILAHHALTAGLKEAAFRCNLLAGNEAMRLFAVNDAILYYDQARRLEPERMDQQVAVSDIHQLYVQLGRAYELKNMFDQARLVYEEMLAFSRRKTLTTMTIIALNRLATLAAQASFDASKAILLLEDSLKLAQTVNDTGLIAETEWTLAQVKFHAWKPHEGYSHGKRALALAREINQPDLIARSLNVMSLFGIVLGRWADARDCAIESASMYAAMGNRPMEGDSLSHLANAQVLLGDFGDALDTSKRMRQINLEIDNVWGRILSAVTLATVYRDSGYYAEALEHARNGALLTQPDDVPLLFLLSHVVLGTIYRSLLKYDDACTTHLAALQVTAHMVPRYIEMVAAELCADYAMTEEWEAAYHYAQQALTFRDYTFAPQAGLPRSYEIEALLRGGSQQAALDDMERFKEQIGESQRFQISYLRCLAVVAHRRGNLEQEIAHLTEASLLSERVGLPGEQWLILAALRNVYQVSGSEANAKLADTRAREIISLLASRIDDVDLRGDFLSASSSQKTTSQAHSS